MPLINANYKWTHSTGKLGGANTANVWQNGVKHDLFNKFEPAETLAGGVYYACCYLENANGTITMEALKLFISSVTPSDDTEVKIGLDPSGVDGVAATIADENTAPAGVTFTAPITQGTGLAIATLAPAETIAVWFELTIDEASAAKAADGWSISTYAEYTEA